jgi:hypothetical protein
MALPSAWVESLLARLTVRYGAAFMRQYADLDPELVKADWSEVLDGASPDSIRYALENLPADKPVNAMQFRDIARRGPSASLPQLPEPPSDPARVALAMDRLARAKREPAQKSLAQTCIDNIELIVANRGGVISSAQVHMVAHCLRMPGTSTTLAVEVAA